MLSTSDVMAGKILVQLGLVGAEVIRETLRELDADPTRTRDLINRLFERRRIDQAGLELVRHRTALYDHVRREAVYLRFLERTLTVDKQTVAGLIARLEHAAYRRRLGEALVRQGTITTEQDRALTRQMWDWLAADDRRILERYRRESFAGVARPLIPGSRLAPQDFRISTLFRSPETRVLVEKADVSALRRAILDQATPPPPPPAPPAPPPPPAEAEAETLPPAGGVFPTFGAQPPPRPAPPPAPARSRATMDQVLSMKRLGEFDLVEVLGQGGMGAVFLGQVRGTGEYVAIKVLLDQAGELTLNRFRREIELLGRIRHPNVIHAIESGVTAEGLTYLVIPALAGKELRDHLTAAKGRGLQAAQALRVFEQVLEGMSAVHAQKVVHRDLKPENLFVLAGGAWEVRIMDFGLAKLGADAEGVVPPTFRSAVDEVAGSPAYIAPESVTNDPVDARTDIYSLGCVFFEVLTGKLPLESETAQGFLGQHLICPPLTLAEAVPGRAWPPRLEALVARMLAKSKDERPASCAEVLAELRALKDEVIRADGGGPVVAPPTVERPAADEPAAGRLGGLIRKLLG